MEPNIKLFGRRIFLPELAGACDQSGESSPETTGGLKYGGREKRGFRDENQAMDDDHSSQESEGNLKTPPADDSMNNSNPQKTEHCEKNKKKKLKKPDKILPCPRCNSSDTKFCYYNNYNINQPRHFCKSCQRYWTAGGTMRNVPVGAGRRKTKSSNYASHCRHITISPSPVDGFPCIKLGQDGTILSFGHEIITGQTTVSIPVPVPVIYHSPYYKVIQDAVSPWPAAQCSGSNISTSPVLAPKMLRINDPAEAAKSSIWTTLGIKRDSFDRSNMFQSLQQKVKAMAPVSPALRANPAALSRSMFFNESA